jgi:uncharacterized delta-60 repeat protein
MQTTFLHEDRIVAHSHSVSIAFCERVDTLLRYWIYATALIAGTLFSFASFAQTYGTLDTSWGGVGYIKTSILSPNAGNATDSGRAVAAQLDGKVVVAGVCAPNSYHACVARYNTNGTLDTSFNGSGTATFLLVGGNPNRQATSIALSPYGHILVVTGCKDSSNVEQYCAIRFSSNGSLDTSFGTNGLVRTTFATPGNNYPSSVVYQSSGRFVLGGRCGSNFCAIRYTENGTAIDTSFGSNGVVTTVVTVTGQSDRESFTMTIDVLDRVLLAGTCLVNSRTVFCVSRYSKDGAIDTSFGTSGLVAADLFAGSSYAYGIALQEDHKILLTGKTFNTIAGVNLQDYATVRYTMDGAVDTSFGNNGVVITRIANRQSVASVVIAQTDGKIVVAGYCEDFPESRNRFCLVGYNENGSIDSTFNPSGSGVSKLLLFGQSDKPYAMTLGRDGKLMVAGECRYANGSSQTDFCVARYHGSPEGGRGCSVDFDANYEVEGLMNTDALIFSRVSRGMLGDEVLNNVPIFANAGVRTWPHMHRFLHLFSRDLDGDGAENATDALLYARFALGFTGNALTNGITFSPNAKRVTAPAIIDYLVTRCAPYNVQP